jgi:hypothetical protein
MNPEVAAVALGVGAAMLMLMGLTASGHRRRGHGIVSALAAGLFFPITWFVWCCFRSVAT